MTSITLLILSMATTYGFDPKLALAVARVESQLNPTAIGKLKEVGLFQVRPEFSKLTEAQLKIPALNIMEGLRILSEAKNGCRHKSKHTFLVCYNAGLTGGGKMTKPAEFAYYKKVMKEYDN